jgi:GNAT superfamily N-acetyltransferase
MIKTIANAEVEPFLIQAKKSGLTFCNSTQYYGYYDNDKLVAITGVIWYSKKAIFKNSYVLEEYRRKGIYQNLFRYRMIAVRERGIKLIEATCTDMSLGLWLKMGAKIIQQFKNYTKVQYKL